MADSSLATSPVDECRLHTASSNTFITAYSPLSKSSFIAPLQPPFEAGSVMELVGCAASVSQLVVYISSSAVSLQRLYVELRSGDSTYRSEANNINLLLNIFQRLAHRTIEDCNPVLPVLIAISEIACEVLCLLKPKRVFGFNWTPITAQDRINSAFESLDKKRRLLHLYISQAHHEALIDLREAIDRTGMSSPGKYSAEKVTERVEPGETPTNLVPYSAESGTSAANEQRAAGPTLQPQAEENSKHGTFKVTLLLLVTKESVANSFLDENEQCQNRGRPRLAQQRQHARRCGS